MCDSTYEFDWDDTKAAANLSKHGVRFEEAMTVFNDPLAMTCFDTDHSNEEDRWITLGLARATRYCWWCTHIRQSTHSTF